MVLSPPRQEASTAENEKESGNGELSDFFEERLT